MTVKEIVAKYLRENGADGLFREGCSCILDDAGAIASGFMGCLRNRTSDPNFCEPGYKHLSPCNKCNSEANERGEEEPYCYECNIDRRYIICGEKSHALPTDGRVL